MARISDSLGRLAPSSSSSMGIRTISGLSMASSSLLSGSIMPSPAPHASKTAQGEGVPAFNLSDVKSETVEDVLLSRRGCSVDESIFVGSSSSRGRLDLNRRTLCNEFKLHCVLLEIVILLLLAATDVLGNREEGHLRRAAAVRAAR